MKNSDKLSPIAELDVLRAIQEYSPDFILVVNKEFRLTYINRLDYDVPEEEVIDASPFKFLHPDYHEAYQTQFRQVLEHGLKQEIEVRIVNLNKSNVWFNIRSNPIFNSENQIDAVLVIATDISNNKLLEQENKINIQRLKEAQKNAKIGSWDWDIVSGSLFWSNELYKIYALDPVKDTISYELFQSMLHPEHKDLLLGIIGDRLTNPEKYSLQHKIIRADNKVRWLQANGDAEVNEQGKVVRMFGTGMDITELKEKEGYLVEQNRIIDYADEAIIRTTLEGKVVNWNSGAANIFQYASEEIIGKPLKMLIPDEFKLDAEHNRVRVINLKEKLNFNTKHKRKDGSLIFVRASIFPILSEQNQVKEIGVIYQDISKEHKHQTELINAFLEGEERERKRLAMELHDAFGQIMTGISLQLYALSEKYPDVEVLALKEMVDKGVSEYRNVAHNIYPEDIEKNHLTDIIRNSISRMMHKKEDRIELIMKENLDLTYIPKIDKKEIFRIFQELIQNALMHSKAKSIVVTVFSENKDLKLIVKDDGIGFDLEKARKKRSSGLGLKNLFDRADLIGASLTYKSKVDQGTQVILNYAPNI